jgi:hypothetical protein
MGLKRILCGGVTLFLFYWCHIFSIAELIDWIQVDQTAEVLLNCKQMFQITLKLKAELKLNTDLCSGISLNRMYLSSKNYFIFSK